MKELFDATFRVAGVTIGLYTEHPLYITQKFEPFISDSLPDYQATFCEAKKLPSLSGNLLYSEKGYDVFISEKGAYFRKFKDSAKNGLIYALGKYDFAEKRIAIEYLPEGYGNLKQSDNSFFHIAWETLMLREQRLIFHASCVDTVYGGVLFSGRSGIGKSTQGDLWCKYEKASLINGDRPILHKTNDKWMAYGSPYAGSSNCHRNANTQISAIVMLKQAKTCTIRRLKTAEAFRKIYAELTISTWDFVCVKNACELAEQLVSEIPVYEMACTPDYMAVELLKRVLQGGAWI